MKLTKHEAFVAMFYFLRDYWERHDKANGDVVQMLSDMQLLSTDGLPVDPAYWEDWQNAIDKMRRTENPPTDRFLKLPKRDSPTFVFKLFLKLCKPLWKTIVSFFICLTVGIIILLTQFLIVIHYFK